MMIGPFGFGIPYPDAPFFYDDADVVTPTPPPGPTPPPPPGPPGAPPPPPYGTPTVFPPEPQYGPPPYGTPTVFPPEPPLWPDVPASRTTITVHPPFTEQPAAGSIWAIEGNQLYAQTFRVLSVVEREGINFDVVALQHEPGKYDATDYGNIIQVRPISVVPPNVQPPPASVVLDGYYVIEQGLANYVMRVVWTTVPRATAYEVEWRRDNGEWVRAGRTGSTSFEVRGIYRGRYVARVRAINPLEIPSIWTSSVETMLEGKTTLPPALSFLSATSDKVFGIELKWGFPAVPLDIARTEIYRSMTPSFQGATKLGDFAFPGNTSSLLGLAAGVEMWFWGRLVDTTGNIGPFHPLETGAGVKGQSSSSASAVLAYLLGQITRTQLGTALLADIDGGASEVQLQAVESAVAAMYTIKTQLTVEGKRYIAGIGIGVENNNGIIESQVLVSASRFAVIDPNGPALSLPFVIHGGQVFMNDAFIETASITTAKIADASITTAKIGTAQIGNAQIADAQITAAKIVDGNITNAKIGDAQITSAKIGVAEVDTLRIGGNAVTQMSYAEGGAANLFPSTAVDLVAALVDMGPWAPGGGGVVIIGNVTLAALTTSDAICRIELIRDQDGAVLAYSDEAIGLGQKGITIFSRDPYPTANGNVYRIRVTMTADSAQVYASKLVATAGKR